MTHPTLCWYGAMYDPSGHADELRGFLRALDRSGRQPIARPMSWTHQDAGLTSEDQQLLDAAAARAVGQDPAVCVHLYVPHAGMKPQPQMVNAARAMFETDNVPEGWRRPLLTQDEIWVPCRLNYDTFTAAGYPASRIRVIGETIDFELFDPEQTEPYPLEVEAGRQIFLTNFDFSERKGWKQLLEAWAQAFEADDPVCLVLKVVSLYKGGQHVQQRVDEFLEERFGPEARQRMAPILLMSELLPSADLPRLYKAADVYVSASRGEAWGRPYMEAMAMGLPTVGSAWGGNLDFMSPQDSWLVEGQMVPVAADAELFNDLYYGHNWFEVDTAALARTLREIADNPAEARSKAAPARSRLISEYGDQAMVAALEEAAESALQRHWQRRQKPPLCAIRGGFGGLSSLALVNDGLSEAWSDAGENVVTVPPQTSLTRLEAPGISHSWPPEFRPVTAGPQVMILPWEYGAPPAEWVSNCVRSVDQVWVPSQYVKEGFVSGGMPEGMVKVVPNGVDLELFSPQGPVHQLPQAQTVFLYVGGTIWRKGIDLLLSAWRATFSAQDDVLLVIKDLGLAGEYQGQNLREALLQLEAAGTTAPILYMDQDMGREELAALYRACSVLVAPYRGEGFGLPMLEAMACGLPVIHNAHGPSGEFVPPQAGWGLSAQRAPLLEGGILPYRLTEPGWVYEVDAQQLQEALRNATDAQEREARSTHARAAAQNYGWAHISQQAKRALLELRDMPLARDIAPARLEQRDNLVLYAPDLTRDEVWVPTLVQWASQIQAEDPITLAIYTEQDPQSIIARAMEGFAAAGLDSERLPDLTICQPGETDLYGLVAAADAVLLDRLQLAEPPAALTRRALSLLRPSAKELVAYRARCRGEQVTAEGESQPLRSLNL